MLLYLTYILQKRLSLFSSVITRGILMKPFTLIVLLVHAVMASASKQVLVSESSLTLMEGSLATYRINLDEVRGRERE